MVLPLLFLSLFFHSKEPSNLSPHSGGILSISSPSIRGTSCFHIHGVCVRGGKGEGDMFSNNSVINDASCSHANLAICNYSVLTSDPFYQSGRLCVSMRRRSHFMRPRLCLSVCLSLGEMSAASHPLPFHSMSARVSVRIHQASLGVDQGENTSLFLPALPPPAPLALI